MGEGRAVAAWDVWTARAEAYEAALSLRDGIDEPAPVLEVVEPGVHQVRTTDLGDELAVVVTPVVCPRCGRTVRSVTRDDPRGFSIRQRKLAMECTRCPWTGVLVQDLADIGTKRADWRPVA